MRRFSHSRLRQFREAAGKSREQVAVELGKSYSTVAFYERGEITPPTHVLEDLARSLEVFPGDFFTDPEAEYVAP
jgi:transcriptional regulator with XRE-family HTH domain